MREPIFKAVCMPPRIFWAPMVPAMLNVAVQAPLLLLWVGTNHNPMLFIFTIVCVHVFIVIYSVKEQHLSNMIRAWGPLSSPTRNVYKGKGRKLAP